MEDVNNKPNWWIEALQQALQIALKQAKNSPHFSPNLVKGIGISGQQHGLVMLDKNDRPLYKAKLWCDTETATENDILIEKLGGQTAVFEKIRHHLPNWLHSFKTKLVSSKLS